MVNQLDMINRVIEHKRRVSDDQLVQSRLQTEACAKPIRPRSIVIVQDLFRLLRARTLR